VNPRKPDPVVARVLEQLTAASVRDGQVIESTLTGTRYVLSHVRPHSATVNREVPKVRGKAARRRERAERRRSGGCF
jgi:hypothetical protein